MSGDGDPNPDLNPVPVPVPEPGPEPEPEPNANSADAAEPPSSGGEDDDGRSAPFGWVSILILVALVVGTWFLVTKLSDDSKLQDCVQSGRRNCAPIDDTGH